MVFCHPAGSLTFFYVVVGWGSTSQVPAYKVFAVSMAKVCHMARPTVHVGEQQVRILGRNDHGHFLQTSYLRYSLLQ